MTSVLVLVGVSCYVADTKIVDEGFGDHPEIDNNIDDLALVLPATLNLEGPVDVREMRNPGSSDEIAGFLSLASMSATEALIFYYSGHGVLSPIDGGLALTHSRTPRTMAGYQALDFSRIRGIYRQSGAQKRIVLLDCCYSGSAVNDPLDDGNLTGQLSINGSYVMTSSPATRSSHVIPGERNSAFTGRLLRVLSGKDADSPEKMTLNQAFMRVRNLMSADALPEPQALDNNALGEALLLKTVSLEKLVSPDLLDPNQRENSTDRMHGLTCIYSDLNEEDNRNIVRKIRRSRNIFFCAHTGYNAMVSQYQMSIRSAIRSGATVRAVITNPNSPLMKSAELTRRLCPSIRQEGEIRDVIQTFSRHQKYAVAAGFPPENVQLRLYAGVPSMNALRIDGWLRIIPYLPLVDAAESPVFEYEFDVSHPSALISRYLDSVRLLWDDSKRVDLSVYDNPANE